MVHIVLIFHGAQNDNLGVGALTASEVEILRSVTKHTNIDLKITIVDGYTKRPTYISGPEITVTNIRALRRPWQFYKLVKKSDLVIDIGGGDSFTDIYGRKRLLRLFMMKYMTHFARKPLVLAPQTVGPFSSFISRYLAKLTINKSALIVTRDTMSTQCIKELGVSKPVIEASDVALRLPYEKVVKPQTDEQIKVGINISGLLLRGGYSGKNMFGLKVNYEKLIFDLVSRFINHPDNCEVHLIPHVICWENGAIEDDFSACQEIAKFFPMAKIAPSFETPSEAKSYISGLDFFTGARMHGCIAAFSSGVPVVPMAYSRKFEGLFGALGFNYTVDCKSDSAEEIITQTIATYENRMKVAEEMNIALRHGLEKLDLYEESLRNLILEVASADPTP